MLGMLNFAYKLCFHFLYVYTCRLFRDGWGQKWVDQKLLTHFQQVSKLPIHTHTMLSDSCCHHCHCRGSFFSICSSASSRPVTISWQVCQQGEGVHYLGEDQASPWSVSPCKSSTLRLPEQWHYVTYCILLYMIILHIQTLCYSTLLQHSEVQWWPYTRYSVNMYVHKVSISKLAAATRHVVLLLVTSFLNAQCREETLLNEWYS